MSEKASSKHLEAIKVLTTPGSTDDAFAAKSIALNRVVEGWYRYFQFAHLAGRGFHRLTHENRWLFARWLATKHQLSYPQVMRRFKVAGTLGVPGLVLTPHSRFKRLNYRESPHKLNPYLTGGRIEREERLDTAPLDRGRWKAPGAAKVARPVWRGSRETCVNCPRHRREAPGRQAWRSAPTLRLPAGVRDAFVTWKASVRARLITLVIDDPPGDLALVSDEVHQVRSLAPDADAVGRVLSP